jgi:hypothetical protein
MQITTLGIDIGMTLLHVIGLDEAGKPVVREKPSRTRLMQFMSTRYLCVVGWRPVLAPSTWRDASQRLDTM